MILNEDYTDVAAIQCLLHTSENCPLHPDFLTVAFTYRTFSSYLLSTYLTWSKHWACYQTIATRTHLSLTNVITTHPQIQTNSFFCVHHRHHYHHHLVQCSTQLTLSFLIFLFHFLAQSLSLSFLSISGSLILCILFSQSNP